MDNFNIEADEFHAFEELFGDSSSNAMLEAVPRFENNNLFAPRSTFQNQSDPTVKQGSVPRYALSHADALYATTSSSSTCLSSPFDAATDQYQTADSVYTTKSPNNAQSDPALNTLCNWIPQPDQTDPILFDDSFSNNVNGFPFSPQLDASILSASYPSGVQPMQNQMNSLNIDPNLHFLPSAHQARVEMERPSKRVLTTSGSTSKPSAPSKRRRISQNAFTQPSPLSTCSPQVAFEEPSAPIPEQHVSQFKHWLYTNPGSQPNAAQLAGFHLLTGISIEQIGQWFHQQLQENLERDSAYVTSSSDTFSDLRARIVEKHAKYRDWCTRKSNKEQSRKKPYDPQRPYSCTSLCGMTFREKDDWKKHEEINRPQVAYVCDLPRTWKFPDGRRLCTLCGENEPSEQHFSEKHKGKLPCCEKEPKSGNNGRVSYRPQHFKQHFSHCHPGFSSEDFATKWTVPLPNNFGPQCGFCGIYFRDWKNRFNHVADHFKGEGYPIPQTMESWKDPWPNNTESSNGGPDDGSDGKPDDDKPDSGNDGSGKPPGGFFDGSFGGFGFDGSSGLGFDMFGSSGPHADNNNGPGGEYSQYYGCIACSHTDCDEELSVLEPKRRNRFNKLDVIAETHPSESSSTGDGLSSCSTRTNVSTTPSETDQSDDLYNRNANKPNDTSEYNSPGLCRAAHLKSYGTLRSPTLDSPRIHRKGEERPDYQFQINTQPATTKVFVLSRPPGHKYQDQNDAAHGVVPENGLLHSLLNVGVGGGGDYCASPEPTKASSPQLFHISTLRHGNFVCPHASGDHSVIHYHNFQNVSSLPFISLRVLGHGASGVVDEVRLRPGEQSIARKTIYSVSHRLRKSFLKELTILKQVEHPHIVEFCGWYSGNGQHALLMSPVADCDLKSFLSIAQHDKSGRWRLEKLCQWFHCLVSGLEYMHKNQICHGDLKPLNILVKDDQVFYTDFGVSKLLSDSEALYSTGGPITQMYAAPEVSSDGIRGKPADIFSLGCVFLEMVTVISRKSLRELHAYLADGKNQTRREKPYRKNIDTAKLWIDKCSNLPQLSMVLLAPNSTQLGVCQEMLDKIPDRRPTSSDLSIIFPPSPCCTQQNVRHARGDKHSHSPAPVADSYPNAERNLLTVFLEGIESQGKYSAIDHYLDAWELAVDLMQYSGTEIEVLTPAMEPSNGLYGDAAGWITEVEEYRSAVFSPAKCKNKTEWWSISTSLERLNYGGTICVKMWGYQPNVSEECTRLSVFSETLVNGQHWTSSFASKDMKNSQPAVFVSYTIGTLVLGELWFGIDLIAKSELKHPSNILQTSFAASQVCKSALTAINKSNVYDLVTELFKKKTISYSDGDECQEVINPDNPTRIEGSGME